MAIRIGVAQLEPVVGDFEGNVAQILEAYERACAEQARLLLTPELGLCGYPPHDLVERPEMFLRTEKALERLAQATQGKSCALAVGHVARNPSEKGRAAQNCVSVLENGKIVFRQAKTLLPTYDVFDESRYFEPAEAVSLWSCDGTKIAFAICEDLWAGDPRLHRIYVKAPADEYARLGAKLVVSLSASPYERDKRERREALHAKIAQRLGVGLIYVNQMGANDEILFDGGSFAVDPSGRVVGRLPIFRTAFGLIETDPASGKLSWVAPGESEREDQAPEEIEVIARGLVVGIRDYFRKTRFQTAIIGLSGGIDSAVVATLAAKALGPKNVLGVAMPSQYSSSHSLADAEALARNLGIPYSVKPIKFLFTTAMRDLWSGPGELAPLAQENLQSRLRALTLMTLSNHFNALVLTTGNKSEIAMGYCTMYGDMAGAIGPIGDLYKVQVYELARYLNRAWGGPIPDSSLTKAPSAELRPNQKDQDSLPPYEALDPMLEDYLEAGLSIDELLRKHSGAAGVPPGGAWILETLRKLEMNEYKRRQAAPVLKVSTKAFGIGRRIPIAKTWDSKTK